jgi:hypothetical protein
MAAGQGSTGETPSEVLRKHKFIRRRGKNHSLQSRTVLKLLSRFQDFDAYVKLDE